MKPPVTYSHPKSVIVMIHMTGGTEMPFRSDGSSYAEATSEPVVVWKSERDSVSLSTVPF
ncbi:hypothetical protein NXV81_09980 [Bacteroides ovatus]|nr:hypothetical protein [Bacteroides ovatus]MCS2815595.1 hypothetical protein [Bacteroides ovatus]